MKQNIDPTNPKDIQDENALPEEDPNKKQNKRKNKRIRAVPTVTDSLNKITNKSTFSKDSIINRSQRNRPQFSEIPDLPFVSLAKHTSKIDLPPIKMIGLKEKVHVVLDPSDIRHLFTEYTTRVYMTKKQNPLHDISPGTIALLAKFIGAHCFIATAKQLAHCSTFKDYITNAGLGYIHDLEVMVPKSYIPFIHSLGDTETDGGDIRIIDIVNTVKQMISSSVHIIQELPVGLKVTRFGFEPQAAPQLPQISHTSLFAPSNNQSQLERVRFISQATYHTRPWDEKNLLHPIHLFFFNAGDLETQPTQGIAGTADNFFPILSAFIHAKWDTEAFIQNQALHAALGFERIDPRWNSEVLVEYTKKISLYGKAILEKYALSLELVKFTPSKPIRTNQMIQGTTTQQKCQDVPTKIDSLFANAGFKAEIVTVKTTLHAEDEYGRIRNLQKFMSLAQ